jgi:dipeptide/tripeptide permease
MPRVAPVPAASGPSASTALRDRPFLAFVALDGLLSMHNAMAQVAIPLWVATATDAPTWLISALLVTNAVAVILLQIRVARGTEHLAGAARAGRRAGLLLALACGVLALTDLTSGALTIALLLAAALVHVLGEMLQSAGGWGISFELAPPGAQGQYQGAYAMGHQVGDLIAPLVLTVVAVSWGWPGWLLTATIFLLAGFLIPVAVRRHRQWSGGERQEQFAEPARG